MENFFFSTPIPHEMKHNVGEVCIYILCTLFVLQSWKTFKRRYERIGSEIEMSQETLTKMDTSIYKKLKITVTVLIIHSFH